MKRPGTKPDGSNTLCRRKSQAGMSLIELLMALAILAIGLGALTNVLLVSMATNNRNSKDTSSTLLAQMVIEQISAQHPNSNASISVTDCAGNTWTVATTGDTSANGGAGANLVTGSSNANYGGIDQSQAVSAIPSGYSMQYVDCGGVGNTGVPTTYDVRWNVMTVDANYSRLITASARPLNSTKLGGISIALPVNLRMVAGP